MKKLFAATIMGAAVIMAAATTCIADTGSAINTGVTKMLYHSTKGTRIPVTQYTNGLWYSEDGYEFRSISGHSWESEDGSFYNDFDTCASTAYRTGREQKLYTEDGAMTLIYEWTDGAWRDEEDIIFSNTGDGIWTNTDAAAFYDEDHMVIDDEKAAETQYTQIRKTETTMRLYTVNGSPIRLTLFSNGSWRDDAGRDCWPIADREWIRSDGLELYDYCPSAANAAGGTDMTIHMLGAESVNFDSKTSTPVTKCKVGFCY